MLKDMGGHPRIIGQYLGGQFSAYNIEVPYPGLFLTPAFLGHVTSVEANDLMVIRRDAYNANQIEDVFKPITQVLVGYVSDVDGITVYSQFVPPGYVFNPVQWSNYPLGNPLIKGSDLQVIEPVPLAKDVIVLDGDN